MVSSDTLIPAPRRLRMESLDEGHLGLHQVELTDGPVGKAPATQASQPKFDLQKHVKLEE